MARQGKTIVVEALYAIILLPIAAYLIFSVAEIWLTWQIAIRKQKRSLFYIQATTEVTHTLLVFAYAQFMVTFSNILVDIGGVLYWPVALFMVTLLVRAILYLLVFYGKKAPRWAYGLLLMTYIFGMLAIIWGLTVVVPAVIFRGFVPDTTDVPLLIGFGLPALALFMVPLVIVYKNAFKQLRK